MSARSRPRRMRTQRGGTIVETLVALPVVVFFFGGIVQVGALEAAALSTRHAAHDAARSAAVAAADDPKFFGGEQVGALTGQRRAMVQATAQAALGLSTKQPNFDLTFAQDHLNDGDDVDVTVAFDFPCVIPIGRFVCGLSGTKRIVQSARYPYQAASYAYP